MIPSIILCVYPPPPPHVDISKTLQAVLLFENVASVHAHTCTCTCTCTYN